jgi:uncharacterized membrane protein
MAVALDGASAPNFAHSDRINHVELDQVQEWFVAGCRDLAAAPVASLSYGLIFPLIGLALLKILSDSGNLYLLLPLSAGFMLVGPALTVGFQAISRDLERGEKPSFFRALAAWRVDAGAILYAALLLLGVFLVWIQLSASLYALLFPHQQALSLEGLYRTTVSTLGGNEFLILFGLLGAAMAALVFAGGAFALPLMIDKKAGLGEAISTSVEAVMANPRPMALWAAMLAGLVFAGMALFYVGLVVTLPIAGHAAWHAYRATIRE